LSSTVSSLENVIKYLEEYLKQALTVNKNIKEIIRSLQKYHAESSEDSFPEIQTLLAKTSNKLENLQSKVNSINQDKIVRILNDWLNEEKTGLKKKSDDYFERFTIDLQKNLNDFGFDLKGHFPNFHVGNVKVKSDPTKIRISLVYGGDEEKISNIQGFDGKAVASTIKSFYEYVEKIDYQKEIDSIFTAYLQTIRKGGDNAGSWSPIIKVMNEYIMLWNSSEHNRAFFVNPSKDAFREIGPYSSRIIFSYILYKILQSNLTAKGRYRLNKKTAIHGAASKQEEHLWLPITKEDIQGENAMYLNFSET
jgi:hypothetical protein